MVRVGLQDFLFKPKRGRRAWPQVMGFTMNHSTSVPCFENDVGSVGGTPREQNHCGVLKAWEGFLLLS